jgi:hypothetical protein
MRADRLATVAAAAVLLTAAGAWAASTLPHRPASASDDVRRSAAPWEEDWRIIALDPASGGFANIELVASPLPTISVRAQAAAGTVNAYAVLANGLLPHDGPGVTIANLPSGLPEQVNSLSYANGRYTLNLTYPAQGVLTITPSRTGPTVGPWHLGPEPVYPSTGGVTSTPGLMWWSVPVATGTVSGWLASGGSRIELHGWRAYHDHVWGRFRRSSTTWSHWDFVLQSPRPGEAWILDGLDPTNGALEVQADDAHWQGVLVHVTPRQVTTCQARIARSGWRSGFSANTPWRIPTKLHASCGGGTLTAQAPSRWPTGGFLGGIGGSAPLPGASGWIEHGMPLLPNG